MNNNGINANIKDLNFFLMGLELKNEEKFAYLCSAHWLKNMSNVGKTFIETSYFNRYLLYVIC